MAMEEMGSEAGCAKVIVHLIEVYDLFRNQFTVPAQYYWLNKKRLVTAVTNAITDRDRAACYHSKSGPNSYKTAAFVGRWLAHDHPIHYNDTVPINLVNFQLTTVNSVFATVAVQSMLSEKFYPQLFKDLQYCFEYRSMRGEEINLLLEHALYWARKGSGQ